MNDHSFLVINGTLYAVSGSTWKRSRNGKDWDDCDQPEGTYQGLNGWSWRPVEKDSEASPSTPDDPVFYPSDVCKCFLCGRKFTAHQQYRTSYSRVGNVSYRCRYACLPSVTQTSPSTPDDPVSNAPNQDS